MSKHLAHQKLKMQRVPRSLGVRVAVVPHTVSDVFSNEDSDVCMCYICTALSPY